jgi:hypothetical protein
MAYRCHNSGAAMFTDHRLSFNPETLLALQEAFDMAWAEAAILPIVSTDAQGARDLIARRIVAAAQKNGEIDPARLRDYALLAFKTPA